MPVLHLDTFFLHAVLWLHSFWSDGKLLGGTPAAVLLCTLHSPDLEGAKS